MEHRMFEYMIESYDLEKLSQETERLSDDNSSYCFAICHLYTSGNRQKVLYYFQNNNCYSTVRPILSTKEFCSFAYLEWCRLARRMALFIFTSFLVQQTNSSYHRASI